jgi:universal stress protein E
MTIEITKILAVIDPTTEKQLALVRAAHVARRTNARVHAYLCCHSTAPADDPAELERVEIERNRAWLKTVIEKQHLDDVAFTVQVEWSAAWREIFADAAARNDCNLIVKSTHSHSPARRRLLKTSDWVLLREARCPVLLVKRESVSPVRRILIAVDLGVDDEEHQRLNDGIIAIGKQITERRDDFELHAVNAYTGADTFTHPPKLAERVGIDLDRAHCAVGAPEDVIVRCASELDSELVVMGTVSRSGLTGLVHGNTAELALDRLDTDVLVTGVYPEFAASAAREAAG